MVEMKGPGPIEGDKKMSTFNIYQSQYERALLENLQVSKGAVPKSLGRKFVEQELYNRLLRSSEKEINRIRDRAREIADQLEMPKEFAILNKIVGALLSTQPAKELSTECASPTFMETLHRGLNNHLLCLLSFRFLTLRSILHPYFIF